MQILSERMTIVKAKTLLCLLCLWSTQPIVVSAQDFNGQWLGTVTESVNRCERIGKAEPGDYKLTIVHKGNDITLMENVEQVPYAGVVNPARPGNVYVQGVYDIDGGYVTEAIEIVFDGDRQGKGHSVWSWSDGYYQCGGRFKFTLKWIRE
jgi:hypothetical protein